MEIFENSGHLPFTPKNPEVSVGNVNGKIYLVYPKRKISGAENGIPFIKDSPAKFPNGFPNKLYAFHLLLLLLPVLSTFIRPCDCNVRENGAPTYPMVISILEMFMEMTHAHPSYRDLSKTMMSSFTKSCVVMCPNVAFTKSCVFIGCVWTVGPNGKKVTCDQSASLLFTLTFFISRFCRNGFTRRIENRLIAG